MEWQRTFDVIEESAAILGIDGRILRCNRALRQLVHASEGDIIGRLAKTVLREHVGIDHPILDLAHEGEASRQSTELRAGDVWYRIVTDPIIDDHGHANRFVLLMTDITSLRGRAEADQRRADELLDDNHRKDEFLAMLAHELRNPLNAIATATALQERDDPPAADRADVRATVRRQIQHLSRVVDDLLDVSRMTRGRIQLQREPTDLKAVLNEVAQLARPCLDARHQSLRLQLPEDPVVVQGDSLRLSQAFANLLSNASKFSDVACSIQLHCEIDRQDATHPVAVVTVVDEGIGIDPARLDSIFEPFVQGETTLARSDGGLGIGLTIARRMVELHDGELAASSAGVGTGTELRVTLPLAAAVDVPAPQPTAVGSHLAAYRPLEVQDVLIIEDDEDAAEMMRALFSAVGHRTRVARDGIAGLADVLSHPLDVALIDIGLPRMNGYEVARRIRRSQHSAHVFLIALTGYGRPEDRARALAAGFDVHLVKPLEMQRVNELLDQRVRTSRRGPQESPPRGH